MMSARSRVGWIIAALFSGVAIASAQKFPLDGYAAMVNDRVITLGEVLATASPLDEAARGEALNPQDLEQRLQRNYKKALDLQVEQALLVEEAKRRKAARPELAIPDRMVEDQIVSIVRDQFGNRQDALIQYMAEHGLTMEDFRQQTRERIEVFRMMREEVRSRVLLPPASVKAEYERRANEFRTPEEVHMCMIMLHRGATEEETAAKLDQARKARARIESGEAFATVAQSVSEGFRANEGGDIGWIKPEDFKAVLKDAITALRAGEVSGVVDGGDGFYILQMMGRREASIRSFEDVRADLEKELRERAEDEVQKEFLNRLRTRHYVRILIPDRPDAP